MIRDLSADLTTLRAADSYLLVIPTGVPIRTRTMSSSFVDSLLHKTRSTTIATVNEQFKGIFDEHAYIPKRGVVGTRRDALDA